MPRWLFISYEPQNIPKQEFFVRCSSLSPPIFCGGKTRLHLQNLYLDVAARKLGSMVWIRINGL